MKSKIISSIRLFGSGHKLKKNNKINGCKNLLVLLVLTLTLGCCHKNDDQPKTELEKLPPATQTGANTAGCLVNGVAFLPKGNFPGGAALTCNYTNGLNFSLSINQKINDNIKSVSVANLNQQLQEGYIYILKKNLTTTVLPNGYAYFIDFINPDFNTNDNITGELKITYHNFNQAILSGTFWFDAINSNGEIVKVREGRFDMHY